MKAVFVGQTSMGFHQGQTYSLKSELKVRRSESGLVAVIHLYDENSEAWCQYSSLDAVLRNWKIIQ